MFIIYLPYFSGGNIEAPAGPTYYLTAKIPSATGQVYISDNTAYDGQLGFDATIFGDYLYINSSTFGMFRVNHDGTTTKLVGPTVNFSIGRGLLPTSDYNYLFGIYDNSSDDIARISIYDKNSLVPISSVNLGGFFHAPGKYPASWTDINTGRYIASKSSQAFGLVQSPAPNISGTYAATTLVFNNFDGGSSDTTQRLTNGLSAQEFDGKVFWSAVSYSSSGYPLSLSVYKSSGMPNPTPETWLGDDTSLLSSLSLTFDIDMEKLAYPLFAKNSDSSRLYLFVSTSTKIAYLTSSSGSWASINLPNGEYISESLHKIQPALDGKVYFVTTDMVRSSGTLGVIGMGRHRLRSIDATGNINLVADIPPRGVIFPPTKVNTNDPIFRELRTSVVMLENGTTPGIAFLLRDDVFPFASTYSVGIYFGTGVYQDQLKEAINDLAPLQWLTFEQSGFNGYWSHLDPIKNYGTTGSDPYYWYDTNTYPLGTNSVPLSPSIFYRSGFQSFDVGLLRRSSVQIRYNTLGVGYTTGTKSYNFSVRFYNNFTADRHYVLWHEGDATANVSHGVMVGFHTGSDNNTFRFFVRTATLTGGVFIEYVNIGPAFALNTVYNMGFTISGPISVTFYINGVTIGTVSGMPSNGPGPSSLARWFCASNDLLNGPNADFYPPELRAQNVIIVNGVFSGSSLMTAINWAKTI